MGLFIYGSLLVLSIMSWGIMIKKIVDFRAEKKRSEEFRRLFTELEGNIVALSQEGILPANSPARLFVAAYEELRLWATLDRERNCIVADRPVVPALERTLDQAIEVEKDKWESGTTFLATTASVGPLLGLLGTVWGVYWSFLEMGQSGTASLDTVAPGIAEALLTTVAGLLVAIPALFGYNAILRAIRTLENQLSSFSSEIVNRFDRQIVVETNAGRQTFQQPMIRRKTRVTS
jgi:biopolymer transport protein ExbB/TolQ